MADFDFIRYANCWEDANLLLDALDIEDKVGLSVLSGGDNTIAMLIKNPKKIVAFDINETQIHLFNLKKAGFQYLNYDELMDLLGIYDTSKSYDLFLKLEGKMKAESYQYFTEHPEFFRKGIVNIGKFEKYFQMFKKYVIPLFATRKQILKLASFKSVTEQKEYYEKVINNRRLNQVFNAFFGFKMMGRFGRDKSFYEHVESKKQSGQKFREHFDYGITHVANYDNPYMNYILTNRFRERCLPLYLKRKYFDLIRDRIDRIEVVKTDLLSVNGRFDFFNLSDIFEYMDDETFRKNCEKLLSLSKCGSEIVYYNMQGKKYLSDSFELLEDESLVYTKKMQAYFYNELLVYRVSKK